MSPGVQIMLLKRENEVGRHLSWAMEGSLSTAESFVKFCFAFSSEVVFLLTRKGSNFSPATGVCWRSLEGKEDGTRRWSRRLRGFVI